MSTIDIREDSPEVTQIVFADEASGGTLIAQRLTRFFGRTFVAIGDASTDKVLLHSKQHALDAIKAIEKAIALGWLK